MAHWRQALTYTITIVSNATRMDKYQYIKFSFKNNVRLLKTRLPNVSHIVPASMCWIQVLVHNL